MNGESLFHFIVICLIIEATPGPNMGYLAVLSMNSGWRAGVATVAGITAGLALNGAVAALGVASAIMEMPALSHLLRWVCMGYLLYLAWLGWKDDAETSPGKTYAMEDSVLYFRRGFIINALNLKAAVFYVSVLPGFVDQSFAVLPQTLALTAVSVVIATLAHLIIVWLANHLQPTLQNTAQRRIFRKTMALLLAAVAIWFVL